MNVLALFVTLPLIIVAMLFLLAIAYMQYLILRRDHCSEKPNQFLVPLSYGVPPPGIACGVSACAPLPHAIETVLPFHSASHPASFPSRVSSVMSIKCIHTEIPAHTPSTTTFTELRDRILATVFIYD